MIDHESDRPYGAISLLEECRETVASLFERSEETADERAERELVEAALYELKIHDAVAELAMPPGPRRRDARFALLSERVRRRAREQDARLSASGR